jgi:hypothetical protein
VSGRIQQAITGVRAELEAGIAEAEAELEQLDARRHELIGLIAQATAALALETGQGVAGGVGAEHARRLTLHEAFALVLRENGNEWMTAGELADAINARHLYTKRDGRPVEINQVHARANKYQHLFEKQGSQIRLQTAEKEGRKT